MVRVIRKGFTISTSFFWVLLFSIIYIIPLLNSDGFIFFGDIKPDTLEKLALISFIALFSFVFFNVLFLRCTGSANNLLKGRQLNIPLKKLYIAWICVFIILGLILILFSVTISFQTIFSEGSQVLFEKDSDFFGFLSGILIEICIFCLNLLSLLMISESHTAKQKITMAVFIIISFSLSSILVFGRRAVIFPVTVIWALHYMRSGNKKSYIFSAIPLVLALLIIMIVMMSIRTFGFDNALYGLRYMLDMSNSLDIISYFISAIDFSSSFNFLLIQLQTNDVSVTPLIYLKPLFFFIPRSLWPDKPEAISVLIMREIGFNQDVLHFSAGTGLVGEALATLGVAGIVIIPGLWGIVCGLLDTWIYRRYMHHGVLSQTTVSIFVYLFFMIQTITGAHRGDTSNAILEFIITYVPGLIFLKILYKQSINKQNYLEQKPRDGLHN